MKIVECHLIFKGNNRSPYYHRCFVNEDGNYNVEMCQNLFYSEWIL